VSASSLRFGLLGPVRVCQGGRELQLGTPQQCAVLGLLLLADGQWVSLERLTEGLWAARSPKAAAATVRTYVSRLRRLLGSDGSGSVISSGRAGYRLSVQSDGLDLTEFNQCLRRGRELRELGDRAGAVAELRRGLGLWRGEALGGARAEYVSTERDRLERLRLLTLQERIGLDIELGRHAEVLPDLVVLTRLHPLEERLRWLQMLALYRAGRQAEALQVYRDVWELLNSSLGVEPGAELRSLHTQVLRADPTLETPVLPGRERSSAVSVGVRPHGQLAGPTVECHPGNADGDVAVLRDPGRSARRHEPLAGRLRMARQHGFVGREDERELFASALRDRSSAFAVLFVHGPAGIGKSALLHRLADDATAAGRNVIAVRGREVGSSVPAFTEAAAPALDEQSPILMVDDFERCAELEGWMREQFLPNLSQGAAVVIAGREPPSVAWRTDPSWFGLLAVHSLKELSRSESEMLLDARAVPVGIRNSVIEFAGGHPLALSLAADWTRNSDPDIGSWQPERDVVDALLAELIEPVPTPSHRMALQVCALADATTEQLLRAVIPFGGYALAESVELFAWLRSQPFIRDGAAGLYPHDLLREVLDCDLRWRDPAGYEDLRQKIAEFFSESHTARRRQQWDNRRAASSGSSCTRPQQMLARPTG
jgi:DNA-binding SARP family transcriptional activator